MDDDYSAGPFCPVFFYLNRDGLRTYAHRWPIVQPARSLIKTISSNGDGGPRFHEVFVSTEFIRITRWYSL